jgi:uncharacterized LabA/DUF88 family protein
MYVLIDYDNVEPRQRSHGVEKLVLRMVDAIGPTEFVDRERLTIRIYGGWFEGRRRSPRAREVIADLSSAFKVPFNVSAGGQTKRLLPAASLADALVAVPATPLTSTYRETAADLSRLSYVSSPYSHCQAPEACSLHEVVKVLQSTECPVAACAIRLAHIATRYEQKLVDTMLVADLIEVGRRRERIAVVSSDDDMWPGILMAVSSGVRVFHFQSRSRRMPTEYTETAPSSFYSQHVLPAA